MREAWSIDIGSTTIKVGLLREDGVFERRVRLPSPRLRRIDGRALSDPLDYLHSVNRAIAMAAIPAGTRVGLCCQRSSFLLWQRSDGLPVTPLYSWQDTFAQAWCDARPPDLHAHVWQTTGLPLSCHYAGPKLAQLLERDPELARRADNGELAFGTLDTFLGWHWTKGTRHITDFSMAARTLMLPLGQNDWGPGLLALFGIPTRLLPELTDAREPLSTHYGWHLFAHLADQAACAVPVFLPQDHHLCLNAGTGSFALARGEQPPSGYLHARLNLPDAGLTHLWEGPLNAGAALFRDIEVSIDELLRDPDPAPNQFLDAEIGPMGAPHWRTYPAIKSPDSSELLEVIPRLRIEAYLFRLREITDDLCPNHQNTLILTGGLSEFPGLARVIAGFFERPVAGMVLPEMGLWGAAWLASQGFPPQIPKPAAVVSPVVCHALHRKYPVWRQWLAERGRS